MARRPCSLTEINKSLKQVKMAPKTLFNFGQYKWKQHYQNCSIARIKYQVDTLKEQYPNSVFLNAGDFFQVRIFYSIILVQ